jgi:hypothetical protein
MKRIPPITITPTIKVQILLSLASWKALLIPYLPQNFQKIISHLLITRTCPKQQRPFFGHQRALGVILHSKVVKLKGWLFKDGPRPLRGFLHGFSFQV